MSNHEDNDKMLQDDETKLIDQNESNLKEQQDDDDDDDNLSIASNNLFEDNQEKPGEKAGEEEEEEEEEKDQSIYYQVEPANPLKPKNNEDQVLISINKPSSRISKKSSSKSTYYDDQAKSLNIKSYKGFKNDNELYPIAYDNFIKFESLLFDCLGIEANKEVLSSYDQTVQEDQAVQESPNDLALNDFKTLNQLDNDVISCGFINDMNNVFKDRIEFNDLSHLMSINNSTPNTPHNHHHHLNQHHLDKNKVANNKLMQEKYKEILSDYEKERQKIKNKCKLLTVVLNSQQRPRKANRLLLNKRSSNSANFDSILNDISSMFKIESYVAKKIFDLNANQINDIEDLFEKSIVFLFIGNEKVHSKDFELDTQEIDLFFANQNEKRQAYLDMIESSEKKTNVSRMMHQTKIGIEKRITSSDNAINLIPQELLDNYEVGQVIGQGHYALVRECKDINTGILFALKIIDLSKNNADIEASKTIENELKILRKVKHTNIIKLVEEYKTDRFCYLIMEYLKDGDLLETVTKVKKFDEKEACAMIKSIASALSYLHSLNIAHRDVKLENILIQKYLDGSQILKLGDFGLAVEVTDNLNQKCGSPIYVAPEVLERKNYGLEVDVWSLGVIAYILICGFAPFQGQNDKETFDLIINEPLTFPSPFWDKISVECIDLIKKMLDRNQAARLNIDQVLNHNWLSNNIQTTSQDSDVKRQEDKTSTQDDSSGGVKRFFSNSKFSQNTASYKSYNKPTLLEKIINQY